MVLSKTDNILIVSHYTYRENENGGGPPNDIRDFLMETVSAITYIELPFPYSNDKSGYLTIYSAGNVVKQVKSFPLIGPDFLQYFLQFFVIAYFILLAKKSYKKGSYKVAFALDNLSTVSLYLWRLLGVVNKLVYYSIDYTPSRFKSGLLNSTYQLIDKLGILLADKSWVVSEPMKQVKQSYNLVNKNDINVVPIGINTKDIPEVSPSKKDRSQMFFLGTLYQKQGLQLLIKSLPKLIKQFPKLSLLVAGTGEYESELKRLVDNLKIQKHVKFLGFIQNIKSAYKLMASSGVGIATYAPNQDSFTYYADPAKIKMYLGCGLPVLTTNVAPISKLISKTKSGEVIQYNTGSLISSLTKIITNPEAYNGYSKRAAALGKKYDISYILSKAIENL